MTHLCNKNVYDVFWLKKQKAISSSGPKMFRFKLTRGHKAAFSVDFYLNSETGFVCISSVTVRKDDRRSYSILKIIKSFNV